MKKPYCLFTIVRNEKYILPIFLKYYSHFFKPEDIFILDHNSDDGSTENLNVNVIQINNQYTFDHIWLKDTVCDFQKELLKEYDVVVFAESDEIIYTVDGSLSDYLNNFVSSSETHKTCTAYEIIHNIDEEPDWVNEESIIKIRNYWFRNNLYDKSLISKIPIEYSAGFHRSFNVDQNIDSKLFLLHLHCFDFKTKVRRNRERLANLTLSLFNNDENCGVQNKLTDEQDIKNYFYQFMGIRSSFDPIHKSSLENLL